MRKNPWYPVTMDEVDEYPEWTERDGDPDGERADWEAYKASEEPF